MSDVHIWPTTGPRAWLHQHLVKQVSPTLAAIPSTSTTLLDLIHPYSIPSVRNMPVFTLASQSDQTKIALIREHASVNGRVYCVQSTPAHQCDGVTSENIALVIYNRLFKGAVQDIVRDLFAQYGPVFYGMSADTCEDEFIQLKMGSCICGFSTF